MIHVIGVFTAWCQQYMISLDGVQLTISFSDRSHLVCFKHQVLRELSDFMFTPAASSLYNTATPDQITLLGVRIDLKVRGE